MSAEIWRAKVKRDAAQAVKEVEQGAAASLAKTQRLRALRLAKEAADKETTAAVEVERKAKLTASERKAARKSAADG
ncbi:MAG: transcriptional regulator [Alphaproteobacteria bacterium]|nr:transcriptional regulator [Alphaproteobacteria bacterium]